MKGTVTPFVDEAFPLKNARYDVTYDVRLFIVIQLAPR